MGRAGCKFIVHFSTLFSTTRNFVPKKNGTLLSCRLNHSQLCHLSGDFGECRFGRLFLDFPSVHLFPRCRMRSDSSGTEAMWGVPLDAVAARAQSFRYS